MMTTMTKDETLDLAADLYDLDTALMLLFRNLDPKGQHDLGGEAGHWFSGELPYIAPMNNGRAWGLAADIWHHLERADRRKRLGDFVDYLTRNVLH